LAKGGSSLRAGMEKLRSKRATRIERMMRAGLGRKNPKISREQVKAIEQRFYDLADRERIARKAKSADYDSLQELSMKAFEDMERAHRLYGKSVLSAHNANGVEDVIRFELRMKSPKQLAHDYHSMQKGRVLARYQLSSPDRVKILIREELERRGLSISNPGLDREPYVTQFRDKRGVYWTLRAVPRFGGSTEVGGKRTEFINAWDTWATPQLGSGLKEIYRLQVKPDDAKTTKQAVQWVRELAAAASKAKGKAVNPESVHSKATALGYPYIRGAGKPSKDGKVYLARFTKTDSVGSPAIYLGWDSSKKKWIKENPTVVGRKAKPNLDEIKQAAALAGAFKGSPAENVREIDLSNKQRDDYAHLGWMEQIVFHPPYDHALLDLPTISESYRRLYDKSGDSVKSWKDVAARESAVLLVIDFDGDEIELTCSADGQQLYLLGGNQASFAQLLGQFKTDTARDKVDLGEIVSVTYIAQKKQAGDTEPRGYYHIFGEERGTAPRGYFDMLNKRIFFTGGSYHVKEPKLGIIN
jgi:hypothetical protein